MRGPVRLRTKQTPRQKTGIPSSPVWWNVLSFRLRDWGVTPFALSASVSGTEFSRMLSVFSPGTCVRPESVTPSVDGRDPIRFLKTSHSVFNFVLFYTIICVCQPFFDHFFDLIRQSVNAEKQAEFFLCKVNKISLFRIYLLCI